MPIMFMSISSQLLTLEHVKTLKMDEDVLGVKLSPNQRLVAVALLDSTIKVFFTDTLKVWQYLSRLVGKPTMWFTNRPDTNRPVQSQKMARDWKFWF